MLLDTELKKTVGSDIETRNAIKTKRNAIAKAVSDAQTNRDKLISAQNELPGLQQRLATLATMESTPEVVAEYNTTTARIAFLNASIPVLTAANSTATATIQLQWQGVSDLCRAVLSPEYNRFLGAIATLLSNYFKPTSSRSPLNLAHESDAVMGFDYYLNAEFANQVPNTFEQAIEISGEIIAVLDNLYNGNNPYRYPNNDFCEV
jgi:hypothetical protein